MYNFGLLTEHILVLTDQGVQFGLLNRGQLFSHLDHGILLLPDCHHLCLCCNPSLQEIDVIQLLHPAASRLTHSVIDRSYPFHHGIWSFPEFHELGRGKIQDEASWLKLSGLCEPVIQAALGALGLGQVLSHKGHHPVYTSPHLLHMLDDAALGSWLLLPGLPGVP